MKEMVEIIASSIVDRPKEVEVTEEKDGDSIRIRLTVADDDMGKVIGKQGRIARAIRKVVNAAAAKADKEVKVDIR